MNSRSPAIAAQLLGLTVFGCMSAVARPEIPCIECVLPVAVQLHEKDPATIWYDDFNGAPKPYAEGKSPLNDTVSCGGPGKSILCQYERGSRGKGGRKVFLGDSPAYVNKTIRRGQKFGEIHWRIYVKHQYGSQTSTPRQ